MNRARLFLLALAWWWLVPAHAFVSRKDTDGTPLHWNLIQPDVHTNIVNPATHAIRYFVAADAYSSANRTAELNAVRSSFDQWQAIPGTILRFEEGGLMPGHVDVNTHDNTNVIFWVKGSTLVAGETLDIRGATAFTYFEFFSDGTLAEADIVLNGNEFSWTTDFNNKDSPSEFIEAILLHEIGHFIGLDHSPVGGATMLARGLPGVSTQAGLSPDEIEAARALYPNARIAPTLGRLRGTVTRNGAPVSGAVVTLEDPNGNMTHGTVTDPAGQFDLPALLPATYFARVSPLDPNDASFPLLRGPDIGNAYAAVDTSFLPSAPVPLSISAGNVTLQNFQVAATAPSLRIARIGKPSFFPTVFTVVNAAVTIDLGANNLYLSIYSANPLSSSAHFTVSGQGVTLGPARVVPSAVANLNMVSEAIQVSTNAIPGLRSILLLDGNQTAYANGFLEILPPFPDDNFDGLDDRFQRRYFPLWTSPDAAPGADPDGDTFTNLQEFLTGTDPTDPKSYRLKIDTVQLTSGGAMISFETAPGKKIQLFRRRDLMKDSWQAIGLPVTVRASTTQVLDDSARDQFRFYRLQTVP